MLRGVAGLARTAGIVIVMLGVRASVTAHRVALRATGLLAVLVGVCAVHGLGSHASMTSAESMSPGIVRAAHAMVPLDTTNDAGFRGGARAGDVGGGAIAGNRDTDSVGRGILAMVLCLVLVVLGVGAAAWWTRRRGRRRLRWAWPSQRGMLRTPGRVPAPPSLLALSVCRC